MISQTDKYVIQLNIDGIGVWFDTTCNDMETLEEALEIFETDYTPKDNVRFRIILRRILEADVTP